MRLLLGARDVGAGASVNPDDLALVDEERDADHGARLELRRLLATRRGVTAHAGIRLDDLELDMRGGVTSSGTLFHNVMMQTSPSLSQIAPSPTTDFEAAYCSNVSGTMKCQKSPSL